MLPTAEVYIVIELPIFIIDTSSVESINIVSMQKQPIYLILNCFCVFLKTPSNIFGSI